MGASKGVRSLGSTRTHLFIFWSAAQIMYKGKAMEFAGAASNAIFKVTSFVDKFKLTEGVLAVGGEGYQTKAKGGA